MTTALKRYGFDDTDPLTSWINAAMHELETAHVWPWMVDVIDATILPSTANKTFIDYLGHRRVDSLSIVSPVAQNVEYVSASEYNGLDPTVKAAWPSFYTFYNEGIYYWPTIDGSTTVVLRVTYTKTPADLSASTDTPDWIPDSLHMAIVFRAAAIALMAENEEQRATSAQAEYDAAVERGVNFYSKVGSSQGASVLDVQGYF
jgi:hypothetical protein